MLFGLEALSSPRWSFVAWLACHGRLSTTEYVRKFELALDMTYVLCGVALEILNHLFFQCRYTSDVLYQVMCKIGINVKVDLLKDWIDLFAIAKYPKSIVCQLEGSSY